MAQGLLFKIKVKEPNTSLENVTAYCVFYHVIGCDTLKQNFESIYTRKCHMAYFGSCSTCCDLLSMHNLCVCLCTLFTSSSLYK